MFFHMRGPVPAREERGNSRLKCVKLAHVFLFVFVLFLMGDLEIRPSVKGDPFWFFGGHEERSLLPFIEVRQTDVCVRQNL